MAGSMAGIKEKREEEYSVYRMVHTLCQSLITQYKRTEEERRNDVPLQLPKHLYSPCFKKEDVILKHLVRTCYDLLLLRRNEWYGRWSSPLTPECRCIAHGYYIHGNHKEADRLSTLVDSLAQDSSTQSVLTFLSILANPMDRCVHETLEPSSSNTYTLYSDSIFKKTPGSSLKTLSYTTDELFERRPGSGFMSFCSQNDLSDNLDSSHSTLFEGLTHTTTPTINTILRIPPLTNDPPDILHRHLQGYNTHASMSSVAKEQEYSSHDSLIDTIDLIGPIEEAPPISWEGPLKEITQDYLSESGIEGFTHSSRLFISLLSEVGEIECPRIPYKRDLCHVINLVEMIRDCEEREDSMNGFQYMDEVTQGFCIGLRSLLQICRLKLDKLISTEGSTQFYIQANGNDVIFLIRLVDKMIRSTDQYTKGIFLLNNLYTQCIGCEGLSYYQMMFGLFRQAFRPYLSILQLWIFGGQYSHCESLGLQVNEDSLEERDYRYWSKGFSMSDDSVPSCLSAYSKYILSTGKALNLLSLCCPQHHLCNGRYKTPQLILAQTLEELKRIQLICIHYQHVMNSLATEFKQQREAKQLEEELKSLEPVLKRRKEARQFADDLKKREAENILAENEKKRLLLNELRLQAEKERAYRFEIEKEDMERDRVLINTMEYRVRKQKELEQQARENLIEYYKVLTKDAELRTMRAQWRARRFALGAMRIQYIENNRIMEQREIEEKEVNEEEWKMMKLEEGEESRLKKEGSIEEENEIKEKNRDEGKVEECNEEENGEEDKEKMKEENELNNKQQNEHNNEEDDKEGNVHETDSQNEDSDQNCESESVSQYILDTSPKSDHPVTSLEINMKDLPLITNEEQPVEEKGILTSQQIQLSDNRGIPVVQKVHSHHSTIQDIIYNSGNGLETPVYSSRGEVPGSVMQDLLYPDNGLETPVYSSRGEVHVPGSVIQDLLYPDRLEIHQVKETRNTRGKPPPTTIQKLIHGDGLKEDLKNEDTQSCNDIHYPDVVSFSKYDTDLSIFSSLPFSSTSFLSSSLSNASPEVDNSLLLIPLSTLIQHCIVTPIITQFKLVNTALVDYYTTDLNIMTHFITLKRFLLLEDGEFANTLSSRLFEKLIHSHSLDDLCSASFLDPLLYTALEGSHSSGLIPNLKLKFKDRPSILHLSTSSIKALEFLIMDYEVDWPMNIVIHHRQLDLYNKVFHLMLEIKRASWALKNVFLKLVKGEHRMKLSSHQVRQIHAQRQELQHFVTVMESYISNEIFHVSWKEFEYKFNKVTSLDELISVHDQFLKDLIFKCLLLDKTRPVMNIIESILSCVMKFSTQILVGQFRPQSLSSIHRSFKDNFKLLFKVISKLVQRGYQPHLEDLLLRLNFNRFYELSSR